MLDAKIYEVHDNINMAIKKIKKLLIAMPKSYNIIGSGFSGLSAAATLAFSG